MALVDYDSSEDEDVKQSESATASANDEDVENRPICQTDSLKANQAAGHESKTIQLPISENSLSQDISWHFMDRKSNTVKILAPEIPEDDPEDKVKRLLKHSCKGSSLMSLLPTPKREYNFTQSSNLPEDKKAVNSKVSKFIPDAVLKQSDNSSSKSKKMKSNVQTVLKMDYSDSEDDGEAGDIDFFSLKYSEEVEKSPIDANSQTNQINRFGEDLPSSSISSGSAQETRFTGTEQEDHIKKEEEETDVIKLDETAMTVLCGSKAKRRKCEENIQIIDVNAANFISDSIEWRTKELTKVHKIPSHKKNHGPTNQQRRKHQITYLAFQAKEQELELTNQWSNNRMTRKQTQAKYGF